MPSPRPTLTRDDARQLTADRGFRRSAGAPAPGRHVGIELEWLTVSLDDPTQPALADVARTTADAVGPLPGGSRITFEPGGQVELSSPPLPLSLACASLASDVEVLGTALADDGVGLVALGLEPGPRRERAVRTPRYDAMEAYFDRGGPAGRTMMRSTAALQVNLDLGDDDGLERRWRTANDLGPVLAAAFANSPFGEHGPSGQRSTRQGVWSAIDRSRTAPAGYGNGGGCRGAWADYALAADVMLIRVSDEHNEPMLDPLRFEEWVQRGHALGWPTVDDLEYHLTTLFPPVRPRGWLELRMIDALPTPWWQAASAVAATLVHEDALASSVARATAPARHLWAEAARDGLANPTLAQAAATCFSDALEALRDGALDGTVDRTTLDATCEYVDRYVARGRTPADDALDLWHKCGATLPAPDNAAVAGRTQR